MFKQEDVVELPKSEYEETISQLMAVKRDNTAKNTIIEKNEAEIERLARQVDELTPFHVFTLGTIELFADNRLESTTRNDMVAARIRRAFPILFQKVKEKFKKTKKVCRHTWGVIFGS